jgi:hypothetical protein
MRRRQCRRDPGNEGRLHTAVATPYGVAPVFRKRRLLGEITDAAHPPRWLLTVEIRWQSYGSAENHDEVSAPHYASSVMSVLIETILDLDTGHR